MNDQELNNPLLFSILIVDDEPDILDTIKDALIDPRYDISCESNPVIALKLIKEKTFDLVLTDLMMPEIGGMDLVNAVKENDNDTFVIVITGNATLSTAIESIQLGVYDYVNKPINHSELKNLVLRATESLALQRRNKELHQKNKRILANLSFLMDISKIIYQVTDLQLVFNMVIDTISEYFKFEKSAIFMEDVQTGKFKIVSSNKLDGAIQNIEFKLPQSINDVELAIQKESIIYIKNNELAFADKKYPVRKNGWIILTPISFRDQIMGFLMVQSEESDTYPSDETTTMLNILASQTSPMMYSLNFGQNKKPLMENSVTYLIRDSINNAREVLSPISFALIRLELISPSEDPFSYQDMLQSSQLFVSENMDKSLSLLWQSQDTALLIMPELDFFNAEIFCKKFKNSAEKKYKAKEINAGLVLHFSCLGYPEAGDTALEITEHLWAKLLQEISSTKNDKLSNHLEV